MEVFLLVRLDVVLMPRNFWNEPMGKDGWVMLLIGIALGALGVLVFLGLK